MVTAVGRKQSSTLSKATLSAKGQAQDLVGFAEEDDGPARPDILTCPEPRSDGRGCASCALFHHRVGQLLSAAPDMQYLRYVQLLSAKPTRTTVRSQTTHAVLPIRTGYKFFFTFASGTSS